MNMDGSEYSGTRQSMNDTDFTHSEYPPLSDVLQKHLTGCEQCQSSLEKKPARLGENPVLCSEWFNILRDYAQTEGQVNNIVAHDEYANNAIKGQAL